MLILLRCGLLRRRWLAAAGGVGFSILVVGALAQAPPGQDKPTAETRTCRTDKCHVGIGDHKVVHGPVAQNKCMACHQYDRPRDHTFKLVAQNEALCNGCHVVPMRTVVQKPVKRPLRSAFGDPYTDDVSAANWVSWSNRVSAK